MLSQVDCTKDPTLIGRIIKTIGRKSTMADLYSLSQAHEKLEEWYQNAYQHLRTPIQKLVGGLHSEEKFREFIGNDWETLVEKCTPKTKLKPGSQKECHLKSIHKAIKDLENRKKEVNKCQDAAQTDTLDDSQKTAIQAIRSGSSVLLMGPPGSGKTHCALYTLDVFGMKASRNAVLYVAPTAELALQAYTNLCETFPNVSIGIVTLLLSHVAQKPKILVGTPQELWSYLCHSSVSWSTAIFDEIHTLSNQALGYSDALTYLMMGMRGVPNAQLIALSATINDDDVNYLISFLSSSSGVHEIACFTLDPSPVPRTQLMMNQRDMSPLQDEVPAVDIKPELLFRCFKKIGYDGTLVFAENDVVTWALFVEMLKYLEYQNNKYYTRIISRQEEINSYIKDGENHTREFERLEGTDSKKAQTDARSHETRAQQAYAKATAILTDILRKELREGELGDFQEKISTDEEASLAKLDQGSSITLAAKYVLQILLSGLPLVSSVGPYFRLVPSYRHVENQEFNAFLRMHCDAKSGKVTIDSDNQTEWSAVNSLIKVAEAESLDIMQVKTTIKTMVTAFKYGIALMMPSLPFVVTHTIRKYLNERRIPFVFSTHEMAVGINYGLRNVFILYKGTSPLRPSLVIQMAGRAGRRGLDRDARIVYANVQPCNVIERIHLKREPDHEMGSDESTCCTLKSILNIRDPSPSPLLRLLRKDIPESRIMCLETISHMGKDQNVKPTLETFDILQDIQAALLGCFQLYFFFAGTPQAIMVERMASLIRKAGRLVTKGCFKQS